MGQPALDIASLTPEERLDLIGQLWDSLSDDEVAVSAADRALLDERLDRLADSPDDAIPWDVVKRRWDQERNRS